MEARPVPERYRKDAGSWEHRNLCGMHHNSLREFHSLRKITIWNRRIRKTSISGPTFFMLNTQKQDKQVEEVNDHMATESCNGVPQLRPGERSWKVSAATADWNKLECPPNHCCFQGKIIQFLKLLAKSCKKLGSQPRSQPPMFAVNLHSHCLNSNSYCLKLDFVLVHPHFV